MRVGDATNCLVLTNTLAFLCAVMLDAFGRLSVLSPSFVADGFCIANKAVPTLQSHALCFYVDTACALGLWALSRRSRGVHGYAPLEGAPLGVFFHGVAHLVLLVVGSSADPRPGLQHDVGTCARALALSGAWLFFFALLRSAPHVPPRHAAIHALVAAPVLVLLVPPTFGFTFVQTALLLVAVGYDLTSPAARKGRFYDLAALMINLPVGLVAWAEAIGCDVFFKAIGGHVWYDASIPLSMFAYYAVAFGASPLLDTGGSKRSAAAGRGAVGLRDKAD